MTSVVHAQLTRDVVFSSSIGVLLIQFLNLTLWDRPNPKTSFERDPQQQITYSSSSFLHWSGFSDRPYLEMKLRHIHTCGQTDQLIIDWSGKSGPEIVWAVKVLRSKYAGTHSDLLVTLTLFILVNNFKRKGVDWTSCSFYLLASTDLYVRKVWWSLMERGRWCFFKRICIYHLLCLIFHKTFIYVYPWSTFARIYHSNKQSSMNKCCLKKYPSLLHGVISKVPF